MTAAKARRTLTEDEITAANAQPFDPARAQYVPGDPDAARRSLSSRGQAAQSACLHAGCHPGRCLHGPAVPAPDDSEGPG